MIFIYYNSYSNLYFKKNQENEHYVILIGKKTFLMLIFFIYYKKYFNVCKSKVKIFFLNKEMSTTYKINDDHFFHLNINKISLIVLLPEKY